MQEESQNAEIGEKSVGGEGKNGFRLPLTFFGENTDENKSQNDIGNYIYFQPHFALEKSEGAIFYNEDLEYCIFNIIKSSEKYIFLVSPFIDSVIHWQKLKRDIIDAYNNGKKIFIILKKPKEKSTEDKDNNDWKKIDEIIKNLRDKIELFLVDYLHAKIYLNEKKVLITSANLESYVFEKNHEIGCLIEDTAVSKWIVDSVIIKEILKSDNVEHTNKGKWAEWIIDKINNGKTIDDNLENNDSPSVEASLDKNKNDNMDNINNPPCESKIDDNGSEDKKQECCTTNSDNKLLTIDDLFKELLIRSNKNDDVNLLGQLSKQLMNKYPFERKDRWASNKNMLQRYAKISRDVYEWALENIRFK
jgi:hypothetical protein